jgi:hypothetical protein
MASSKLRREGPPLAIVSLVVLAGWLPVVAGARSVAGSDLFHEHVPFRAFVAAELARGELPLWAPGIYAGYPLHANGEASLFSPLEAALRVAGLLAHRESDATFVLSSLMAAGFAYALGRALGMRRDAACLSAVAYGLSGRLVAAAWPNAAVVAALAPALLLAVERMRRDAAALGPPIGFALALGAALLAGRPQSLVPVLALVFARALGKGFGQRLRPLVLGVGLGLCLGAPQSLPTLALVEASSRAGGMSAEDRALGALAPADLAEVVAPVGHRADWPEARSHAGVVTLALAVLGAALAAFRRRASSAVFFFAAALAGVVVALGPATPLHGLLGWVPYVRSLRVPARFLIPEALALAVAGGLGLDLLVPARQKGARLVLVAAVALELVAGAWLVTPWCTPLLYEHEPHALALLRALPKDASGAPARYLYHFNLGTEDVVGVLDPSALDARDPLGDDRALLYDLSAALGYGEPVAAWQADFLSHLPAKRRAALGVAALADGDPPGFERARKEPLPRAMVVPGAVLAQDSEEASALLESTDPWRTVVFEDEPSPGGPAGAGRGEVAKIENASACTVVVAASSPAGGWLVLHDAWDPGWRATVAGEETPVRRAFGFFRAVRVPPGQVQVRFDFEPPELRMGLVLAAVGALAVLLSAVTAAWKRRASRP